MYRYTAKGSIRIYQYSSLGYEAIVVKEIQPLIYAPLTHVWSVLKPHISLSALHLLPPHTFAATNGFGIIQRTLSKL